MDQLPVAHVARPDRVVKRRDHQLGGRSWTAVPADDLVGERIAHAGQPQHPLAGEDPGQVGDPLAVRRDGGEVTAQQVRRRGVARVLLVEPPFQPLRR